MEKNCHGKESPQEAAGSEVKARTQRQTILACPLFYSRSHTHRSVWNAVWTLTALLIRVLQKQGLGYNNWDNCTKGATLMSAHGHLLPFPPQTHFLSVAIEEFPLFYQSLTAPGILDIATILPKDLTLAVTSSPPFSFNMPHSLWRSSYLSPVSTHFSAPPPALTNNRLESIILTVSLPHL